MGTKGRRSERDDRDGAARRKQRDRAEEKAGKKEKARARQKAGKEEKARTPRPKKECCLSDPRCARCPIRMLKEGTLPPGWTVHRRRLVRAR